MLFLIKQFPFFDKTRGEERIYALPFVEARSIGPFVSVYVSKFSTPRSATCYISIDLDNELLFAVKVALSEAIRVEYISEY